MRKLAWAALGLVILTPLLFVGGVLLVIMRPTVLINPATIERAARLAPHIGGEVSYASVETRSQVHGFLDTSFQIQFTDLCVAFPPTLQQGCLKDVELAIRYRFRHLLPEIKSIGPITMTGGDVSLQLPEGEERPVEKKSPALAIPELVLPSIIRHARFGDLTVEVQRAEMVMPSGEQISGALSLEGDADPEGKLGTLDLRAKAQEATSGRSATAELTASSASGFREEDWKLALTVQGDLAEAGKISIDGDLLGKPGKIIEHDLRARATKGKLEASVHLQGAISEEGTTNSISGELDLPEHHIQKISLRECRLALQAKDRRHNRAAFTFACPVLLSLRPFKLPKDLDPIYLPPDEVTIRIGVDAETFLLPDPAAPLAGKLHVDVTPSKSKLVETKGVVDVAFSGTLADPPKSLRLDGDLDVDFMIEEFSKLVAVLSSTPYAMPAPFNVLDGSLTVSLKGKVRPTEGLSRFPITLQTRLTSTKQQFDLDGEGTVSFLSDAAKIKRGDVEASLILTNVRVALPNLDVVQLPQLFPDGRIKLETVPQEPIGERMPFAYDFSVRTEPDRPVRIYSNLTPSFIPLGLDVRLTNDGMGGSISILQFDVTLFRRKADVESMKLTFAEPMEQSEIAGTVKVTYPDYTVRMLLTGTLDRPRIVFESDPPLSQDNIIAVLLYGQPYDELDTGDASSVGGVSDALADRALALTSLFLFASTPIQSVGYNPETKVVSAKIKLGEGTSLNVGSSGTEHQIGIQRRLGKGWRVNTTVEQDEEQNETQGTAYIEWHKRY